MNNYSQPSQYRQKAPAPVLAGPMDREYDYGPSSPKQQQPSQAASNYNNDYHNDSYLRPSLSSPRDDDPAAIVDGDEALLDLAQLEELHREAEKMKALGNKHMATQEYTRAYNAYSAALQLSPVGPSSHVFLSNRAAALLSLKRYNAAATDAKRAIALAPTFGKAHARLGQALYFLKDYDGAVSAYQDAIHYEPDNQVTQTYLEKAKAKVDKHRRKMLGEEVSVATSMAESHFAYVPSVATSDPNAHSNTVMGGHGYRGVLSNPALANAVGRKVVSPPSAIAGASPSHMTRMARLNSPAAVSASASSPASVTSSGMNGIRTITRPANTGNISLLGSTHKSQYNDPNADPDFEEALRIQVQANKYLANKQYKNAMEEYTAALFLVPDDVNLSPELHLGRAHALNGSRRHERARNDCILAIKLKPSPAAFSTLAKSYFYMKDYKASLQAFQECIDLLPAGESLGMFDRAYYEKAEAALEDEEASLAHTSPSRRGYGGGGGGSSVYSTKTVPKLPPPRFVPRDEAMHATPHVPSMPKQWPQQSPRSPTNFRCGPEHPVLFLSESLGIKLNRGSDGMVRVLSVNPSSPTSTVVRRGEIGPGDVIRECAGVDLRRPITNIMWGDTVALIKMAPRPITFVVAKELSDVPPIVVEEMRRAMAAGSPSNNNKLSAPRPSNASGDEPVRGSNYVEDESSSPNVNDDGIITTEASAESLVGHELSEDQQPIEEQIDCPYDLQLPMSSPEDSEQATSDECSATISNEVIEGDDVDVCEHDVSVPMTDLVSSESLQLRSLEDRLIGGEILFDRSATTAYFGWDNLRWLSYSGARKVAFSQLGYRYYEKARKQLFWSSDASSYEERLLAIYDEPSVILMLRRPTDDAELVDLLGLDDASELAQGSIDQHWVVESVLEPSACVLKLSHLTNVFAIPPPAADERRLSCIELRTPVESILFSAVRVRDAVKQSERSFGDSGAFLETAAIETALSKKLCTSRGDTASPAAGNDLAWKHQIIQGTLHAVVVSGNTKLLESALDHAMVRVQADTDGFANFGKLPSRVIDEQDESGHAAIWYAITRRMGQAVSLLVKVGANVDFRDSTSGMTLVHLSARLLDETSLSVLLASGSPRPNPNALDALGRTPMYLACVEGDDNPRQLDRCLRVFEAWGGKIMIRDSLVPVRSPVTILAALWRADMLSVVLRHMPPRRVDSTDPSRFALSVGASYEYPLHSAVSSFGVNMLPTGDKRYGELAKSSLGRTLHVLLDHGFEVNERWDSRLSSEFEFIGFTPLQILMVVSFRDGVSDKPREHEGAMEIMRNSALILVRSGARLVMESPPPNRPLSATEVSPFIESAYGEKTRSSINWSSRNDVLGVLGLDDAIAKQAWNYWNDVKAIAADQSLDLLEVDSLVFPNVNVAGGSDDKSCAICWKQFGALLNRKHKCRATRRFVCDDCSTKRLLRNGKEYRISDGQYTHARAVADEVIREQTARAQGDVKQPPPTSVERRERQQAEEESNRNSLFGSMLDSATEFIFGDDARPDNPSSSLAGLSSTLNETRNALEQRGDRLTQLGDKSADLVDASESFAKMAKELARQSERGFFW